MVKYSLKRMNLCRTDVNNCLPTTVSSEEEFLDMDLATVARDAIQDVQAVIATPFLKQKLKTKIQNRRLARGEQELMISDSDSEEDQELSPEETQKMERRRHLNKLAAQRCRSKKKENSDQLTKEIQKLESHNTQLRHQIRKLSREKAELTESLQAHANVFHVGVHMLPQGITMMQQ